MTASGLSPLDLRPPAMAGSFYPVNPKALRAQACDLLTQAQGEVAFRPKALIVPHAGYIYSGPIAASAYRLLEGASPRIQRVVLVGPSHHMAFEGMALPRAHAFATPLGIVPVDLEGCRQIEDLPGLIQDDRPHAFEHCLEVQLPFLQVVLKDFQILPLVLGDHDPRTAARALHRLWGGPETLVLISSDLSHFLPYDSAQDMDRRTVDQVLGRSSELEPMQACGATAINALLRTPELQDLKPTLLDLRNSGDTAGDRSRVVGYTAIGFHSAFHSTWSAQH